MLADRRWIRLLSVNNLEAHLLIVIIALLSGRSGSSSSSRPSPTAMGKMAAARREAGTTAAPGSREARLPHL
jgi:hypothetical protein